ncbi:MAG: IS66 family transposase [Dehalococcoidia bacterium]
MASTLRATAAPHAKPKSRSTGAFEKALLTFVADPRVPADNNAAERSVRPLVVVRKISGGTRSAAGSLTRTVLSTITQSWQAQGQHQLDTWTALLRDPSTAPVRAVTGVAPVRLLAARRGILNRWKAPHPTGSPTAAATPPKGQR